MKISLIIPDLKRNPRQKLAFIFATLLIVAGLFLTSAFVPPVGATPVHVMNAPLSQVSQLADPIVAGTLASFTALIPETFTLSLPILMR